MPCPIQPVIHLWRQHGLMSWLFHPERIDPCCQPLFRGIRRLSYPWVITPSEKDLHVPKVHHEHWTTGETFAVERIRRTERIYRPAPKPQRRPDGSESFKCRHCRAFVGPTISGGKHRNHCPICLYSRHVDRSHPGDRRSECKSLMAPIGTFHRADGEQMILHRCGGCGAERHNRIAADDSSVILMRLPLVEPRQGKANRQSDADQIAS